MVNTRYEIPRALKKRCRSGSLDLRNFYFAMFIQDYIAFRGEVDFDILDGLSSEELQIADRLVNLNLHRRHCVEAAQRIQNIKTCRA